MTWCFFGGMGLQLGRKLDVLSKEAGKAADGAAIFRMVCLIRDDCYV